MTFFTAHSPLPNSNYTRQYAMAVNTSDRLLDQLNREIDVTFQSGGYIHINVLILYWQDGDPGYANEARDVRNLFEHVFHYPVTMFAIPSEESYTELFKEVAKFFGRMDEQSLLIVHYGGHGDPNDDDHNKEQKQSVWAA